MVGRTSLILLAVLALSRWPAEAQTPSLPIPVRVETLVSAKLGEQREFWVPQPDHYHDSGDTYPALCMMDRDFNFNSGVIGAAPATAQTADRSSAPPPPTVTWRVAVGQGTVWVRDVASSRLGRHVDASAVSWEGHGGAFAVEFDRATFQRLHHFEGSFEQSGSAVYRTPLAEIPRPAGDAGRRVAGSYEYRRYLLVDLGVRGFDLGLGVQGGADRTSVTRHFDPTIQFRARETSLTTGIVAAARLRRWRRVQAEAAWVNGGGIARATAQHSAATEGAVSRWGVGWLTDLTLRADVRVSSAVTIFASYFDTGRGRFVSHDASASGRRRWMVGVSHGR